MPEVAAEAEGLSTGRSGTGAIAFADGGGGKRRGVGECTFLGASAAALRSSLAHALEASWYPSGERLAVEQVVAWKMAAEVLHLWGALEVEEAKEDEAL